MKRELLSFRFWFVIGLSFVMLGVLPSAITRDGYWRGKAGRVSAQASPTIRLETVPASGEVGQTFSTAIIIDNIVAPGLSAWESVFSFEPGLLEIAAVRFEDALASTGRTTGDLGPLNASGAVELGQYSYGSADGPAGSNLHVATITWTALATGTVALELHGTLLVDLAAQPLPSVTELGESVEVLAAAGRPGDCNSDDLVDAGDISALILEVFDGDGSNPANAGGGLFPGSADCDANEDGLIDAGDVSCTALIVFNGPGACNVPAR